MEIRVLIKNLRSVEAYLAHKETEYTQLYDKYQGVRPGWVSAELAIIGSEIQGLKKEVTKIKEMIPHFDRIPQDVD